MPPKKKASRAEGETAGEAEAEAAAPTEDSPMPAAAEAAPAKEEAKPEEKKEVEKPKEPEKPKELEADAPNDKRKRLADGAVAWNMADCTLNVLPAFNGNLLTALGDSGFEHLFASVRANTGMKAGRYMFETKVFEQGASGKVLVGLSLADTPLLSDENSVFFDNDGWFVSVGKKSRTNHKFLRGQAVALVVNLDASSPNADTVSVFVNGRRSGEPQKLPEAWKGKALFPVVTYKNVTLQVNFGPKAESTLPFTCRMLADAAQADVDVVKQPAGGQQEVLFPVCLPDRGVFDWADDFLAKNPSYSEISARKIIDWAVKSHLFQKGGKGCRGCMDQPEMGFGIPELDNLSVMKLAKAIAPFHKGNFLIMEQKSNLVAAERSATLAKFPGFRKRAAVLMGEPSADYKTMVQGLLLNDKKKKAEAERKRKAAEVERKRAAEATKRKLEAAKKARLAGKKDGEEVKEAEEKEEEKAAPEEEPVEPVALTDEEKAIIFRKKEVPDMLANVVAKSFANFSLPAQSEGFDAIDFLWQQEAGSAAFLQDFILQKKIISRVESLTPGDWFKKEHKEWQVLVNGWKKRQNEWKNPGTRKALLAKIAAEKKAAKKEAGGEGAEEDVEPMKIDADDLDVFSVEDVMDIGSGEPLFANFEYEDWALLSLRFELHLLAHAFKKDLADPERTGFHESHVGFYYNKYFHKQWSSKTYGCNSFQDVCELVKENASLNKAGILEALLSEDAQAKSFVHLVEEHRRDRARRVDAGVESAKLKFQKQAVAPQQPPNAPHRTPVGIQPIGIKRPFVQQQQHQAPAWKQARVSPTWTQGGRLPFIQGGRQW